ncbi:MAG TPA: glycosyltransferase family 4 protein [Planctomycetota bacterium]|nr:glycosyltransferase family 4 protein [Planctomycetota bacterium]
MLRVAYLNSQYPSISHTFIEREVRELRARGLVIDTFSINPPRTQDRLGDRHAAEAVKTFTLKVPLLSLIAAQVPALFRWRFGYLRAIAESQRLFSPGLAQRARSLAYVFEAARLARELDARGLRHVHVHMANNGAAVALLACTLDPRLTYSLSIHGSAEFFDVHRLNLKAKCERALFVRCISSFCKAQIMAWTDPAVWERFHVVHCAVDPDELKPSLAPSAPSQALRLLTVGRLEPIKGYPLLLEAVAKLAGAGVDVRLEMIGDGTLHARLREQIARLGLDGIVTMSGALSAEELPEAYDRSEVLVVSSFMEGVPVVLMEAMAKGLIVVSTAVGGVTELVAHGVNGLVVTAGSVESLVEVLADLAQQRHRREAMGAAAREVIVREFSIRHLGSGMQALFERTLSAKGTGSESS